MHKTTNCLFLFDYKTFSVISLLTPEKLKAIVTEATRIRTKPVEKLFVRSFEDGVKIWDDEDVKSFFYSKSMKWQPKNEIAVFLPCSAWKPYPYSPSHKYGYLKALFPYLDRVDLFVVSEPMTVVPYCYSDEYPVDSYDYNPDKFFLGKRREPLVKKALSIFTSRLATWIKTFHTLYQLRILILPKNWHLKVFYKSLSKVEIPANDYKVVYLPGRAKNSVSALQGQLRPLLEGAV